MARKAVKHDRDTSDLIDTKNKRRAIEPDYDSDSYLFYLDDCCEELTLAPPSPPTAADITGHLEQTRQTAEAALEHYNSKNHTKYSLVEPVNSNGSLWAEGIWYHVNFKAKPETSSEGHGDLSTVLFFAELKIARPKSSKKFLITACRPIHETKSTEKCEMCEGSILHPTRGFRQGLYEFKQRVLRRRLDGKVVSRTM